MIQRVMIWLRRLPAAVLLALVLLPCAPCFAGQPCAAVQVPTPQALVAMLDMAARLERALDDTDAQVVIIGRVGQDLSRWGMKYSHAAFAWKANPLFRWGVVHLLNECGTADSHLYREGLGAFFTDVIAYDALVLVPSTAAQARIAQSLSDGSAARLHSPRYNMVAHPFSDKYQNSNQWVLETLALAKMNTGALETRASSRSSVQAWLREKHFAPQRVEIGLLKRLGADIFRANVTFDDQPTAQRIAGQIDTISVESIQRFWLEIDPGSSAFVVRLP